MSENSKKTTDRERVNPVSNDSNDQSGATTSGVVYGNVSNASTNYGSDKFTTPRGHGFAAEQANHLYDKVTNADFFGQGKTQMVGEEIDPATNRIVKNGADRIVNGTNIQTKYCSTGGKCISECFEDGKFRYLNSDGTPMQIEVPSDKYDAAIRAMEDRIKKGEIPGVTDPKDAEKIVRKGHFTYEQAKNIAKAGTIESITFDAVNGAIIATGAFGISTAISFATSVWNGESFDTAIKSATYTGLKVGGTTFVTAVLASQLSKAGLNSVLVKSSESIVKLMGPKAAKVLANAFRSGSNIYGAAAMKSAAKMLRGNAITGVASVVILSSVDVVNIFKGKISGKQLFKNVANTTASVAGGTAGWIGGATAGATIGSAIPIIGTAVGGFVGGLLGSFIGGSASSKAANSVLGAFIVDDADEMVSIIEKVFQKLASDYLLNQTEAEAVVDALKDELSGGTLKDMFASSNREKFAKNLLINHIKNEVSKRKIITLPSAEEMQDSLRIVLEEIADEHENDSATSKVDDIKQDCLLNFTVNENIKPHLENQDYSIAMISIITYFAKCDGEMTKKEESILQEALASLPENVVSSEHLKEKINLITSKDNFTFFQMRKYLDRVELEQLLTFKDLVNEIIRTGRGVRSSKKPANEKFNAYLLDRQQPNVAK